MSTMYYTYPDKQKVGQTHSLGKDKGYHFTWAVTPDDFANMLLQRVTGRRGMLNIQFLVDGFVDEYGNRYSFGEFRGIVKEAKSYSFDERIE